MGHLQQNACSVTRIGLAAARAAVVQVAQDLNGLLQDPVGFAAFDVHDEANSAGFVLVPGIV
jgi:hypothetical protein